MTAAIVDTLPTPAVLPAPGSSGPSVDSGGPGDTGGPGGFAAELLDAVASTTGDAPQPARMR